MEDKVIISSTSNDYYALKEKTKDCEKRAFALQKDVYEKLATGKEVDFKDIERQLDAINIEKLGYEMRLKHLEEQMGKNTSPINIKGEGIYTKSMVTPEAEKPNMR